MGNGTILELKGKRSKRKWKLFLVVLLLAGGGTFLLKEKIRQTFFVDYEKPFENVIIINNERALDDSQEEGEFRFAVFGDTQDLNRKDKDGHIQNAVASVKKSDVDFLISVGDQISSCEKTKCKKKIVDWKKIIGDSLLEKTFVVIGNHDRTGGSKSDKYWREAFAFPENGPEDFLESVYSFDYENSHFVFLNSEKPEEHLIDNVQRNWLTRDLENNDKKNVFVFFHEPAFPMKSKVGESLDEMEEEGDLFWEIVDEFNVTAVFNGHEHIHSRRLIDSDVFPEAQNEIYQFIVGNTDAYDHKKPSKKRVKEEKIDFYYQENVFLIVEVKDQEITVELYEVEGKLVDIFEFSKS